MSETTTQPPSLIPRFVAATIWVVHRTVVRLSGRRIGLWKPKGNRWGTLRLTTTGRKSGTERRAILGYYEEGPNLVTMAMNGWYEGEPAWWLNLKAHPDATVALADGTRRVRGRAAEGEEHERLWARWREMKPDVSIDAMAPHRSVGTPVVILEPREPPAA